MYSLWADPSPFCPDELWDPDKMSLTHRQPCGQFQEGTSIWKVFKNTTLKLTDFKEPKQMLKVKQGYIEQGQISQCV